MFRGMMTALITPFRGHAVVPEIDYPSLEKLIEWQLECGVEGFVTLGTTGESATLTPEERIRVIEFTRDVVRKRVPLIAGTGTNDTAATIAMTKEVKKLGLDGALVVSPYYNKPTQEGLFQHFQAVAREGGMPVVVYNIPGRTSVEISVDVFRRLLDVPNIVAVKEASGSADKLLDLVSVVGDRMAVMSGEDSLTFFVMAAGGTGVISASANAIPREMVAISRACAGGNFLQGKQAQLRALPAIRALFAETNPAPAKAVLKMLGKIEDDALRLPLVPVRPETRALLERVIEG